MLNSPVARSTYKVQSGVVEYPIGFSFQFNSDGSPQLEAVIGTTFLQLNHNCKLSESNDTLILTPTEEEAETLTGPEDYSWMDKWTGWHLVISRAIPFVQESDYQLGRISAEQIERDFDASVMRDQQLSVEFGDAVDKMEDISQGVEERLVEVEAKAEEALQGSWEAKDVAEEAHVKASDALPAAQQAETNSSAALEKAATAESVANSVRDIADQANTNAENAYANASAASVQASNAKVKADQALAEAQMARQIANSKVDSSDLATRELIANKKTGRYTSRSETEYPSIKVAEDIADLAVAQGKVGLQNQITTLQETSENHTTQLEELTGIVDDMEIQKADKEDIANIGGEGTVGQVLTKTEDGFSWQDATGGGVSGDYATVEYVDEQYIGVVGYVDNKVMQLKKDDAQLNTNTQTVANWVNAKDSEGNRAVLETEAQDAYRAINELNAKIGTGGGASLPDQTGNAGKFLRTDGTEVSWGDAVVNNNSKQKTNVGILGTTSSVATQQVAIGDLSNAGGNQGISVGGSSSAKGNQSIAIGAQAKTAGRCAIQIGYNATNSDANTFKVANINGNFELMDADGNVPLGRLTYVTNQIGDISTALSAIIGE